MRRNSRRNREEKKSVNVLYIGGIILALGIIAFVITFVVYGNNMDKQTSLSNQKIASLVQEGTKESTEASTEIGKTVEESKNEIQNTISTNNVTDTQNTVTSNTNTIQNSTKNEENTNVVQNKKEDTKEAKTSNVISFIKPVDGEISKDYAKDKLIYSETLEEWTTHLGWDIEADKTTVVKASEAGIIKSIKNDPRYGLSIVIEHQDGYKTLYANLLSTEFVSVGEEVKQGQSIGTVGNTAMFEIADETHLHFEITKDEESIDPNTIVK
jgi:murein DD-endopeptidase MepM/ murein hydrolase activator NlpD